MYFEHAVVIQQISGMLGVLETDKFKSRRTRCFKYPINLDMLYIYYIH